MHEHKLIPRIGRHFDTSIVELEPSAMVGQVRDAVWQEIGRNRHWPTEAKTLQLRDLAFTGEVEEKGLRCFALLSRLSTPDLGYGAAAGDRSSRNEPFYEYCLTALADGTNFEVWTRKDQRELTRLAINGKEFARCKTTWSKFLWDSLRTRWDIFVNDKLWGHVETGDYLLFGKYIYCRHLVRWNSLKVTRPGRPAIPLYIARYEEISDFLGAAFRLATLQFLWRKRPCIFASSFVIPHGVQEVGNDEITALFATSIAFRAVFFDLAYKTPGG